MWRKRRGKGGQIRSIWIKRRGRDNQIRSIWRRKEEEAIK
jgi:hypothetical protein